MSKAYKGDYLKHILIVLAVTLPILLLSIFAVVVPYGNEFKDKKKASLKAERELRIVELERDNKLSQKNKIEFGNKELLAQLREPKPMLQFLDENLFVDTAILKNSLSKETEISEEITYQIKTRQLQTTLQNFYDLIENSNNFGIHFQLGFPIFFSADKGRVESTFNMTIYKLKPFKQNIVRPYTDIQK
jgi:hypothetical protein